MNTKILVLFLVLASLFISGCAEEDAGPVETDEAEVSESDVEGQDESLPVGPTEDHIVRLEYYEVMKPSELDISRGDSVSWWSYKKQGTYVLVSEDDLFSNTELKYSVPFSYTFDEAGIYSFTVEDVPAMNMTVTVN
ncbi:cell surface lipoprotein [Methanosarcina sp. Mfa9]|uniref:cell surface lipoprotein n=1 Tax=Methanosarcina sp. Mfa9 TaxID=3439063 RepID=UPI003F842494